LKIALCSPVSLSYWGGAEKRLSEIGTLLFERGYDVKIYAFPYEYEGRNVDPTKYLEDIPYSEKWGGKIEADITYLYYQPMVWRLFDIKGPKIAGLHSAGLIECITPYIYLTFKILGDFDLNSFNKIHVVSQIFNLKHKCIEYIPNWIDLDVYKHTKNKLNKFTLLYVGRKRKEKGWPMYLKVCTILNNIGYNFNFFCTGNGEGPVKGLSYISDSRKLAKIYSSAHLVVYPSIIDTFGLVIVEALACGTPVLTTSILPHRYLDLPLFYANNINEYLRKILSIHKVWENDNQKYIKVIKSGMIDVKKYDKKIIFPKLEDMLIRTANGE
jgi:glycosyltransferase involved in cell wall biosynthesis